MTNIVTKPKFEEVVAVTTMNLPDFGLTFNAQSVGPGTFRQLREADYGPGFRMPTIPELVSLVYSALENRESYETAKNVVETLRRSWLTGNTGIHYAPEGAYIQDNSELRDGRIHIDSKELESRLGSHEEAGVVFSDDKTIRFVPYGFKTEKQTSPDLAANPMIVALAGSKEGAEMLSISSQHFRQNPYLWVLSNVTQPETRVAGLGSYLFDDGLDVYANDDGDLDVRVSFGVLDSAEGTAPKN